MEEPQTIVFRGHPVGQGQIQELEAIFPFLVPCDEVRKWIQLWSPTRR